MYRNTGSRQLKMAISEWENTILMTFCLLPGILGVPAMQQPQVIAPPPFRNDDVAVKLQHIRNLVNDAQPRQKRDVGSYEAGRLYGLVNLLISLLAALQSQQATTAASPTEPLPEGETPSPTPPTTAPASGGGLDPLLLAQILALTGGFGGGGRYSDDANELATGYSRVQKFINCAGQETLCHPETKILNLVPFPDHVLALSKTKTFRIDFNGDVIDHDGISKDQTYKNFKEIPTASLRLGDLHYIFYGRNVSLLSNESVVLAQHTGIENIFFKVKEAIRGAFRFNDHTLTLFLDRHFIFYQPLANPPVDPRFSPQPIYVVPGGPNEIDGAMEINNKKCYTFTARDGYTK
ncbi:uncharacterized protein LOC129593623 isoform X2 [Paramacrobiotus metropolitanus]|uniref:uncharacterized protein LOC129593623 isoform X2 n=1 Tax=Paramacrobiotus metropolitanus TaxID=2943436 RepID=UPI00244571E1|nr:uncharacterized protein LOC129593623 isoform X2 [Paramacrobiotus metropolitanus]